MSVIGAPINRVDGRLKSWEPRSIPQKLRFRISLMRSWS